MGAAKPAYAVQAQHGPLPQRARSHDGNPEPPMQHSGVGTHSSCFASSYRHNQGRGAAHTPSCWGADRQGAWPPSPAAAHPAPQHCVNTHPAELPSDGAPASQDGDTPDQARCRTAVAPCTSTRASFAPKQPPPPLRAEQKALPSPPQEVDVAQRQDAGDTEEHHVGDHDCKAPPAHVEVVVKQNLDKTLDRHPAPCKRNQLLHIP